MASFRTDTAPLSSLLQETERAVLEAVPKAVDNAAEAALAHVKRRTGRGIGVDERQFVPYSAAYARQEKGGRRQPVTLVRRGDMMNDLRVVKTGKSKRTIKFASRQQERKGRWNQRRRRWFGLTIRYARRMREAFGSEVAAALPKDRRRRIVIEVSL